MQGIFKLSGVIQHYAWGGKSYIPKLLGIAPNNQPTAEYWLGAHVNSPSKVEVENSLIPLDQFIDTDPVGILGEKVSNQFGGLPFLFKVLDVYEMLSIQVHPTKKEAEKGFKKEEEEGIPLSAFNRNYKDKNHKPEIMVALSDFWLLHGFLPKNELADVLVKNPEFSGFVSIFEEKGYKGLYQHVMELPSAEVDKILQPIVDKIIPLFEKEQLSKNTPEYWAAKAVLKDDKFDNYDKGIFSIYFFNIVNIQAGEGIFQDAGVPHAYLEGQNMELMANSDNVLRGGLTPKHVDVPELLKHVIFEETKPEVIKGRLEKNGIETKYLSPAPDFELSKVILKKGESYQKHAESLEIYLLMQGQAEVKFGSSTISLKKGESFLSCSGADFEVSSQDNALFYKATTPS